MDSCTWTCQCWPTSKYLFASALCGQMMQLENLTGAMNDWEGWREKVTETLAVSST